MKILPRLVINQETKILCMQVSYAGETETKELPDIIAGWPMIKIQEYVTAQIPEMIETLRVKRRKKIDLVTKKAGE